VCTAGIPISRLARTLVPGAGTRTPLGWFDVFRPEAHRLLEIESMNVYVTKLKGSERPPWIRQGLPWPPKWVSSWSLLSIREYDVFEGLVITQGYLHLPAHSDYFSAKWPYRAPFHLLMTRDRFEAIRAALHFVPELRTPENESSLYKVDPILNRLRDRCRFVYRPDKYISADESICQVESKKMSTEIRYQKMPKPIGEGLVFDLIAESKNGATTIPGYIIDFEVRRKGTSMLSRWIAIMDRNKDVLLFLFFNTFF
jgi:hypothetical protein